MKSHYKIVVQGTKLIADYLKKNLEISNSVFYSKVQDDEFLNMVCVELGKLESCKLKPWETLFFLQKTN